MLNLIENELMKIFKRKNIFILLILVILIIITYNLFIKLTNPQLDISKQYQNAYNNDKLLLANYNEINVNESYEEIEERIKLEEYALNNKLQYNIFVNTENSNALVSSDARILLMKIFDKFDIIIVFILIYISSTILSEEYVNGTIKYLLIKPHIRVKILFSKVITIILLIIIITSIIVLFQFLLGGILFGFGSYSLDAIIYNNSIRAIEVISLEQYMATLILVKMLLYFILSIISLLFGIMTNNMAINILLSVFIFVLIHDYDILCNGTILNKGLLILGISAIVLLLLLTIIFKKKDIKDV